MEFPFDINPLFPERVSVLDQNLGATRKPAGRSDLQDFVATVIDELGRASAKAQQLPAPVTSASKLQTHRHQLYLLKDAGGNGGRGAAVGFLKVGYKKLFLLDRGGAHVEAEPLCVLDFYVSEKLQRHGYGLELFHFLLRHRDVDPALMAYDRPSPKLLAFLAKQFGLSHSVPQVNNFVVFDGFFVDRSAPQLRKVPPKRPDGEIKPYSLTEREEVHRERGDLPWPFGPRGSPRRSASSQSPSRRPVPPGLPWTEQQLDGRRAARTSFQGSAARLRLYSRHLDAAWTGQAPGWRDDVRPHENRSRTEAPAEGAGRARRRPAEAGRWSWLAADACQEPRSTRPW